MRGKSLESQVFKKDVSVTTKPGICLSHRIPVLVLKSAADSLALIPLQREIWYLFSEEGKLIRVSLMSCFITKKNHTKNPNFLGARLTNISSSDLFTKRKEFMSNVGAAFSMTVVSFGGFYQTEYQRKHLRIFLVEGFGSSDCWHFFHSY